VGTPYKEEGGRGEETLTIGGHLIGISESYVARERVVDLGTKKSTRVREVTKGVLLSIPFRGVRLFNPGGRALSLRIRVGGGSGGGCGVLIGILGNEAAIVRGLKV